MEYKTLPDLKHLETLSAVVELGGVAQAARKLNIGQPAVTKRLRALDNCYGISLMQREGRQLELTEAGELVYHQARLALDQQATLFEDLAALRGGQNKLRLEATFAIAEHLLPDLLLKYSELHPDYQIETRMGYSRRIQTRLATGLSDLALLEISPEHPDILVQSWLDDEIVLVCGPGHSHYQTDAITPNQLHSLRFVMREPNSSMRLTLDRELAKINIHHLPITMEVGSTDTITEMLQRGQYVSFLPYFAVAESLKRGRLHRIRIEGLSIKRTLWISRTKASMYNNVANSFVEMLSRMY